MLPLKNQILKQYTLGLWQNVITSQFVYSTLDNCLQLRKLSLKIKTRKQKKIHFFYLWLLTKKRPYLKKFYPSWKNTSQNLVFKTKVKTSSLHVTKSSKKQYHLLYAILMEIISKTINSEKKIWTFKKEMIETSIFSVPITKTTAGLQIKNTYFPTIPLRLQFQFSKATAFEKLFFLRSLKILSPISKIPALDCLS